MSSLYIFVDSLDAAGVFESDSTGQLTHEQAEVVANRYMDRLLDRIEEAYPDAEIEVGHGKLMVQSDEGWHREMEVQIAIDNMGTAIWESGELWEGLA